MTRRRPGMVRDAIVAFLADHDEAATVAEITAGARALLGADLPESSVRSYLRLGTPELFRRPSRGRYTLAPGEGHAAPTASTANGEAS